MAGISATQGQEPEEARAATEEERVLSWEEEQFRKLGLNDHQAAALADAGVSWHDAFDLFKRGCPRETVVDLLL